MLGDLIPAAKKAFIGNSFSASVFSAITTFASACTLLIISRKELKKINKDYFKLAVPTGAYVGVAASLLIAIGDNANGKKGDEANGAPN